MFNGTENILLIGAVLILLSVLVGKTSTKSGVPTLIFFLIVGIFAGSEGFVGIHFEDPNIAQFIGVTALIFILFSGGLDTSWKQIRPVLWQGITLSTLGVLITAGMVGLFVHYTLDFTLPEAFLLGSIVSSTDAAAVFSILRRKGVGLKGNLRPVLEFESGSNDPMAYFLTIALTTLISEGSSDFTSLIPIFFWGFLMGGVAGYLIGRASHWLINNIKLDPEGLYPVLLLGIAVFTYSFTEMLDGNGFLAVYVCAIVLGNGNFIHRRMLIKFYDGQAWLMQIILFLTLGLLVFPSRIVPLVGAGLVISAFLIIVARPAAVFISYLFFRSKTRNKLFISWVGLRGAVPIVFATYPMIAGLEKSDMIFHLVFFISVTSVLLQGTTLSWVARKLHVTVPEKARRRGLEYELGESVKSEMKEYIIPEDSNAVGKKIVQLHIPATINILTIRRDDVFINPVGSTELEANDTLLVLAADRHALTALESILQAEPADNP